MTTRNDGGAGSPRRALSGGDHGYPVQSDGMSPRDWFAGQALSAFNPTPSAWKPDELAARAYEVADAMLAAREKEGR